MPNLTIDAIIIGAGAAGLHCAGIAGQRGVSVLLIDHAKEVAEKIRISGGGRCNFTNLHTGPENFLSDNPRFVRSALARYTPADFIALLHHHRVAFHEKHKGQLFCDGSSAEIIDLLLRECGAGGVERWQPCSVQTVTHRDGVYTVATDRGEARAPQCVVATGGLSIPKIGASDFGHRIARQFGLRVTATRPGLVPLTFDAAAWTPDVALAGVAVAAGVASGNGSARGSYHDDLLFTHRGLSGPAVLQISNHWLPGAALTVDLAPLVDVGATLLDAKRRRAQGTPLTLLAGWLPRRVAERTLARAGAAATTPIAEWPDKALQTLGRAVNAWQVTPNGTEGYRKAEVTLGGVDTRELSSTTLESRRQPGLHVIGEALDVTGWLGGYNFQWAWASAAACAMALRAGYSRVPA